MELEFAMCFLLCINLNDQSLFQPKYMDYILENHFGLILTQLNEALIIAWLCPWVQISFFLLGQQIVGSAYEIMIIGNIYMNKVEYDIYRKIMWPVVLIMLPYVWRHKLKCMVADQWIPFFIFWILVFEIFLPTFYFIFIFYFITCSNQAECEELQSKVENLTNENHLLREELHKLAEQCEKLTSENNSIMVSLDS